MVLKWAEKHPEFDAQHVEKIWETLADSKGMGLPAVMTSMSREYLNHVIRKHGIAVERAAR